MAERMKNMIQKRRPKNNRPGCIVVISDYGIAFLINEKYVNSGEVEAENEIHQ